MANKAVEIDEWEGGTPTREVGINFGKEGDWFKGTFIGSKMVEGKYGLTKVWQATGIAGTFHKDEGAEQVVVSPGSFYYLWDKPIYHDDLSVIKVGQKFGIMFTGMSANPSKKTGKHYKMYQVKQFEMDENYSAPVASDSQVETPDELPDIMDPEFGKPPFEA